MPQMQRSRAMQPESLCGGGEDERGGRKQGITNSKPVTGIDDRYTESSFFKVFPRENRRIDDSARGRVGNGACARRAHPPPRARALCRRTGVGGGRRIEHP
jgi:hypothetical protein